MSILRIYEIVCDYCGCAEHFQGSIKTAESQYEDIGGIIKNIKSKKYFCSENCFEKYKIKEK